MDKDLEQAARWHALLEDTPDGASGRAANAGFRAWYGTQESRRRAFATIAAVEAVARDLKDDPELRLLSDAAFTRATSRGRRPPRLGVVAAVGAIIVVPVAALTLRHPAVTSVTAPAERERVYATETGGRKLVTLPDGTRILLDTATRLTVRGSTLAVRGQAAVTAGSSPFTVAAAGASLTMRSGSLNVRTAANHADILVRGGSATVTPDAAGRTEAAQGSMLSIARGRVTVSRATDPDAITSWQTGWLQFDDAPLARAVREVNRYRPQPIRLIGDASRLRISGSFRTGVGEGFMAAVDDALPVSVDRAASPPIIRVSETQRN